MTPIGIRQIIDEFFAVLRQKPGLLAGIALAIMVGYSLLDLVNESLSSIVGLVVTVMVQYQVVEALLEDRLPAGAKGNRRYGSLFLASLLGGLGTVVGLVLLVVPGIVLMAGWAAATPFIVVDRMRGAEALGASWAATRGSRFAISVVVTVAIVVIVAALVVPMLGLSRLGWGSGLEQTSTLPEILLLNLLTGGFTVAGWVFGCALYRLVKPDSDSIEQVFA